MKFLGRGYSDIVLREIIFLTDVHRKDSARALGTDGSEKATWTSFLVRNDFGIMPERHEPVGRPLMFMNMV